MRSRMLQDAEALSRWLTWLHHCLNWIVSAQSAISSAQEHEIQELEADLRGKLLQHQLPGFVSQHKQLWDEICAWESSIRLHCEEGIAASNCHGVLETADFETVPIFIGIRKMLARSVNQLKADWYVVGSTSDDVASAIQKAIFTSLCEAKPLLPSQVIKSGAALLIIHFYQLKIAWWRYWRHLEALTAKLGLLRDLQSLENWLTLMEEREDRNDLGSSLEETMVLTEEHRKFSRVVDLQGEKCRRLAEFEMAQLEESDPDWETAMANQMVENLERLNILPKVSSISDAASSKSVPLQEEVKPVEDAPFGRMEGVLYRKLASRRYSNGVISAGRWQKCFALLKSNTMTLHVLSISDPPTVKRSWISENAEVDFRLPLCREMTTSLVEQRAVDMGLFKIHNLATGDCHHFKAETRALAEKWVAAINKVCLKSPAMEDSDQELMRIKGTELHFASKSLRPTRKSQSTTCLPILRLISKRSERSHRRRCSQHPPQRRRRHSSSSTSTMDGEMELDTEIVGIRSLNPHTLLSSLGVPTLGSGAHSRAAIALTLPLRALCRRVMRHSNLPVSVSHHSHLNVDGAVSVGNGGGGNSVVAGSDDEASLMSPFAMRDSECDDNNDNSNNNSETDIDNVDEFS